MENRKNYVITFDDCDGPYYMSLTKDQIKVLKWLKEVGWGVDIIEQEEVIVL